MAELRRLVGRAVETKYKGLDIRCVFSDDTNQRGALGFVCDTYISGEKSHRTVYSHHVSPTHVAVTTVGPANHRTGESLPASLFSAKFVVAREASWARAFFKPAATAAAEVPATITHQQDVHAVLLRYLGSATTRAANAGPYTIKVVRGSQRPHEQISVCVQDPRTHDVWAVRFESQVWATTPRAYLVAVRSKQNVSERIDVNVASMSVKDVLAFVLRTIVPLMTSQAVKAAVTNIPKMKPAEIKLAGRSW